ncbi:putative exported protein [Pectobacterium atrosepticum SCRI1043]|uniref:Exported protein n=1 Tax=Pectobacterium atrosepticum (strain SCRI 1043 / ATCC BAA-672) TaxID=218491 RepID=Q6D953_PECAS|nr:hypothetical protein [Pectobacterium atrosepticum]GKV85594.1 hypothetical protein PEC301296_19060 [Pectobacterium carotovorum subsp. carotovorum]AIA69641.1 hypothetical protein EV46_03350 [Pectobacterium atrosepticum]AIK12546.1 putative exported protein [Pectobacterium atrosepticum]ATY89565.1 hypothetical protein CVS35_03915 [Pectobacterium atrosepticum]KMK80155.1 hypothetical protein KCQ_11660 [Pectobacterium atrosepticum ICMP 1526]
MKHRYAIALFILSTLTLPVFGKSMEKIDIKLNPHPKMRYEITLTIEDAPGPFDAVKGSAGYEVANGDCVPLTPFSGATLTPRKNVPMALTRVSDKVYKGELYVDLLTDEDYFGRGLCRWSMPFANFALQIGNLTFAQSISLEDILASKSDTRYFNKLSYVSEDARSPKSDHPRGSSGNASRAEFKDPTNTFSISLSAKEKFQ